MKRVTLSGSILWLDREGEIHRTNQPAYINPGYYKSWFKHGKRHRLDGPAVEFGNGNVQWWIEGVYYNSFSKFIIVAREHKDFEIRNTNMYFELLLKYGTDDEEWIWDPN